MNDIANKPDFTTRFRHATHLNIKDITANVQEYFKTNWKWPSENACASYLRYNMEHCALSLLPTAPASRIEVVCLQWSCFWILDDVLESLDKENSLLQYQRSIDVFLAQREPSPQSPIEMAIADIRARILAPEHNVVHQMAPLFFDATRAYVDAAAHKEERLQRVRGSIDRYLGYRMDDAGVGQVVYSGLWAEGVVVPSSILSNPKYQKLYTVFGRHFSLVNDLYSYEFELHTLKNKTPDPEADESGRFFVCNLIDMLLRQSNMTQQEAMEHVKRRLSVLEDEFFMVVEELKAEYSHSTSDLETIERLSVVLEYILGGAVYWSSVTPRYNELL